jgi:hypothetical protein
MKNFFALSSCCLCALLCSGAARADIEQDLQGIKAQRSQLEDDFDRRIRACHQKFNVNDCLKEVAAAKNKALSPLLEKQRELQSQLRAERADQRRAQILDKQRTP